jgi:signal transduction histidine kinase
MQWITPDGRSLEVEVSAASLAGRPGEQPCLAILARDAAGSLRLERQMIRSEKLAAVGSLAAGLAHEIGTPLNVISATAEYLLLDQPEEGGSRAELAAIVEETDRIGGLVRDLLNFTRETPPVLEPISLVEVVERAIGFVRISVEKSGAHLEAALDASIPLAQANADELHQVLVNLILNASQAARGGGRILVRVAQESRDPDNVLLEVHDNGPGIPLELRERVFDPFFTTRSEGTGLGLTVCARIVRGFLGDLRITDSPLGGACLSLRLPALEPGSAL